MEMFALFYGLATRILSTFLICKSFAFILQYKIAVTFQLVSIVSCYCNFGFDHSVFTRHYSSLA